MSPASRRSGHRTAERPRSRFKLPKLPGATAIPSSSATAPPTRVPRSTARTHGGWRRCAGSHRSRLGEVERHPDASAPHTRRRHSPCASATVRRVPRDATPRWNLDRHVVVVQHPVSSERVRLPSGSSRFICAAAHPLRLHSVLRVETEEVMDATVTGPALQVRRRLARCCRSAAPRSPTERPRPPGPASNFAWLAVMTSEKGSWRHPVWLPSKVANARRLLVPCQHRPKRHGGGAARSKIGSPDDWSFKVIVHHDKIELKGARRHFERAR